MRGELAARRALGVLACAALLSGCAGAPAALNPQGPVAARIADLWWLMFALAAVIFGGVMGLLAFALFHPRRGEPEPPGEPARGTGLIVGGGIVMPAAVLLVVFGFTLWTMTAIAAYAREPAVTVQVTGHQWWWEVRYPEQGFTTANEIHIPAGRPVRLELASADVVHNFWVPELHGKVDTVPGHTNTLWLQADQPGVYRGRCAEYCGTQHARMELLVVAEPPEQFQAWLEQQQQAPPAPTDPLLARGRQVFLGSACVYCHAIRGTNATSTFGPDLTHLASRRTLGAGALENTRANLAGWITNPHSVKPGNRMPPVVLNAEDLHALIAYLESLE
ncbi:MAG TPA: cytochrome c oxidase subunit II [Roseiflexaceae bacterium]|nr:cytochrome c oxidase subunit II [Roseiflexaceae bacterium]